LLVGIALALAAGLGVAFAAELVDKRIQDPAMLTGLLGYRPLAVLPYIDQGHERAQRMIALLGAWVVFVAILGVGVLIASQYAAQLADALRRFYY
jgi:hypothetical protein